MPNRLTVADARADMGLVTVSNVCGDSPAFLSYLNAATRSLYRRGDWFSLMDSAQFCTQDGCIVLPAFVGKIRAINIAAEPTMLANHWYEFALFGPGAVGQTGASDFTTVLRGRVPVFKNVPCGTSRYIRAYAQKQADLGKTVTLYGIDDSGQVLMTKVDASTWTEGVTLTLAKPFASTSVKVKRVDRVSMEARQGTITLFQYDADTDLLHEMATYGPKETEPSYQLLALSAHSGCASCDGNTQVQILFKLALYPLVNDTDILPIQNLEALKFQLMSVKKMEAGDSASAFADTALAVKEMNLQDAEEHPDDNIPVLVQPFGSAGLKRHRIGSCI